MEKTVVIAIGGNAIIQSNQKGTTEEQIRNIRACSDPVIDLIEQGFNVVITHGNGPQVGNLLLQNEAGKEQVPQNPLDVCGAQTQGSLGYLLTQTMRNKMHVRGLNREIACVLTQVVVDNEDPKFKKPTKPIGPFYNREEMLKASSRGMTMVEDAGRGYRRVVASPQPLTIIEKGVIQALTQKGIVVVAVGGGGIPVVDRKGELAGVEAVIDKDLASALLAKEIAADYLVILTEVDHISLDFGKPTQRSIKEMSVSQARDYLLQGQFPPGSMGPKVEAAIDYVESTGKEAVITSIFKVSSALAGTSGTRIVPNDNK